VAGAAAIAGEGIETASAKNALESADLEMFAANETTDTAQVADSGTLDISGADDNAMDFDMGSFGNVELPAEAETIQTAAEEFGHTMPSLDVPTFAAPQFMPETSSATDSLDELGTKTDELVESFEFPAETALKLTSILTCQPCRLKRKVLKTPTFLMPIHLI
jgi:hypothetical protein